MKRSMAMFCVAGLLLIVFFLYGIWPRNDERTKAYIDYLGEEGLLAADGAMYAVELTVGSDIVTAAFHSQDYSGSLKECAVQVITHAAECENVSLPAGFEDELVITKVLDHVERAC